VPAPRLAKRGHETDPDRWPEPDCSGPSLDLSGRGRRPGLALV